MYGLVVRCFSRARIIDVCGSFPGFLAALLLVLLPLLLLLAGCLVPGALAGFPGAWVSLENKRTKNRAGSLFGVRSCSCILVLLPPFCHLSRLAGVASMITIKTATITHKIPFIISAASSSTNCIFSGFAEETVSFRYAFRLRFDLREIGP